MASRSDNSSFALTAGLLVLIAVLGAGFLVSRLTAPDAEPASESRPAPRRATPASKLRARQAAAAIPAQRSDPARSRPAREAGPAERAERPPRREPRQREPMDHKVEDAAPPPVAANPPAGGAAARPAGAASTGATTMVDFSASAIDRALADAGITPEAMADIRLRYDELAAAEKEVRDEAVREGWLDSPRFAAEMDALAADRLALRDEIGDEAYDLVLFATGQTNRVLVKNVEQPLSGGADSLQVGDVIVAYDGVRIFSPAGLLTEMAAGTPGRVVRVDVLRQGKPIQLDVPDGLIPVGIDSAQEPPERLR